MDPYELEGQSSYASSSSRAGSLLSRTLSRRARGSASGESSEDFKGPLGLTTIYSPSEPGIAELVFVHGLSGGSRSTWSKDPSLFWPQVWLPQDDGFRDVRIHTFGYNSNWNKASTLNIHDFAKSLLGSLLDCPLIPKGSTAPIVFVGHSMGGLVIKRAYILARQMQEFDSIAHRVHAMFFLATPHRGSDLAQTLSRILQVAPGPRPFVDDLHRNSIATQSINDEFPQHCANLQLHSFYETAPMNYVTGKGLIVDKDSATLGYRNERREYLNANHREVCKYATHNDPNYLTVRNALASAIDSLRNVAPAGRHDLQIEQRRLLDNFLGTSDAFEDDLMDINQRRLPRSCEWILDREKFLRWRDSIDTQLYWLNAKPAVGKTVLSGYIINHLRSLNQNCIFYFFSYNDKLKSTIISFLRSVAWQMAQVHPEVLQSVLNIYEKDSQLGKLDYRTIWRKLYVDGILKVKLDSTRYLVIDGLDECKSEAELVPLLLKIAETGIRILVTSRNRFETHRHITHPRIEVASEEINTDDTENDISLYLEANMHLLPSINNDGRQKIVTQILRKSAGCFLWVCLVLQELSQVHTSTEIRQVLENIPSDMNELYTHILDNMSQAPYGKLLAKAILTWTVCSERPLTTYELHHALQLDIKDSIDDVRGSIGSYCNQLVHIDPQSRVHILHQTARDFLLRPSPSEFTIVKSEGHKRIAMTCLDYLNSNEMKNRGLGRLSVRVFSPPTRERSPFVSYACNSLFTHIGNVSSADDDLLCALAKFLNSSNVLSWIEYLAEHSNLDRLIKTGEAIRNYLQRRTRHVSPIIDKEAALLDSWAIDLVRLVTRFGKNLSETPSSIYHLVPPFCPRDAAPRRQFAASPRSISVLGLSSTGWDDCLSTMYYPHENACALSSSDALFAVGLSSGRIVVYQAITCQEINTLQHGAPVRLLEFGMTGKVLSSACTRSVCVWDTSAWQLLWRFTIDKQCLSLSIIDADRRMLGAMKNNHLMLWDLVNGQLIDSFDWTEEFEGPRAKAYRRPTFAALCAGPTELSLLAVLYRGQDIVLWDLDRETLYDTYGKEGSRQSDGRITNATVWSVAFSTALGTNLLAAAYSDGDLVLFDTSEGTVQAEVMHANAQTLVSSPNGRTLASGDSAGTIQLFEFETLKLLYRIRSEGYSIKALAFSGDSRRLLDIRGSHCRVWDLMVLVRPDFDEENSETSSITFVAPQESGLSSSEDLVLITALVCHAGGEMFFCGKEDGSVWLYETKNARQLQKLFSHAEGVSIAQLLFDEHSNMISSTDSSSRITTHKLFRKSHSWECSEPILDIRAGVAVDQIMANKGHSRLLVCSPNADSLYSLTPDGSEMLERIKWKDRGSYRWGNDPSNQHRLILIMGNVAHLYDWRTLTRLTNDEGIVLKGSILPELSVLSISGCFSNGSFLAAEFTDYPGTHARSKLLLFHSSDFNPTSPFATPVPKYSYLTDQVECIIGPYGPRLLFLNSAGWICSTDQDTLTVRRHFFVPTDWLSTSTELMIRVARNGDILFVKRDEVAVIKRGLEHVQPDEDAMHGRRPSLMVSRQSSPGR